MLFRYSAVTFNSHRIHYDTPYSRDVEGYPDLVVNGGLTSLLLLEHAKERLDNAPLASFATRNMKVAYVNVPIGIRVVAMAEGRIELEAVDEVGDTLVSAKGVAA